MKIEDLTLAKLKEISDDRYLHILRTRFLQLYDSYFKNTNVIKARGLKRRDFLNRYIMLRKELASRGFTYSEETALDKEVLDRIFRKGIWTIDVPALEEIVIVPSYISAGERFVDTPKDVGEIDLIVKDSKPKENNALELKVADQIRREAGKDANFTYSKKIEGSYMPMWDLVLRPRKETKKVAVKRVDVWKKLSVAQRKECDEETAKIKENKEKAEARKPHEFRPAEFTHPNGHPRCLVCGDEEPIGKICNMKAGWYEKHEWDDEAAWAEEREKLREGKIIKASDFQIKVLGSMAQLASPLGKHFSLLIHNKDKNILIDPAVRESQVGEEVTHIIVTQSDEDHWKYLNEFKEIPLYSTGAIIDKLPKRENTHLFLKHLKLDGLEIFPFKTTHKVGIPSIGLRVHSGTERISILPEFLRLGKAQKDLIKGTIWMVGCGDYEKDDEEAGKLSFLSLIKLAEELKPKAIYLTNLRKDLLKHESEVKKELEKWNGKILRDSDELGREGVIKKADWGLNKPAYRIFEIGDLKNTPHFDKGKAIVEAKWDGVRTKIIVKAGKAKIITDPEETKTPDKTKRLPWQVEELEAMKEDNFVGDAEVVMFDEEGKEVLHRTTVNALINGKFDPTEASKQAHVYIFNILEDEGKSIKSWPLKERKELLSKFKDTEHVHFVRPSTSLDKTALSYVVDLENLKEVEKAKDRIMGYAHKGGPYPKHISEGVLIKLLDAPYESPQSHSMVKWKEKFEIDCLVVGKHEIIREGKPTANWNYDLAVGPIEKEWADAIARKDKKATIGFKGKRYNAIGKSDNTKENVAVGSILRVASEDINRYETDEPEYPYYKAYVSVVLQPVPEKNIPDKMLVLRRLSEFTPRREALVEKSVRDDVKTSVEAGKIPKEIYEEYAKENEPLPKEFYVDPREGRAWMQTHIRGLEPEDVKKYKKKEIGLAKLFEGHSIHLDIRMDFGLPRLVQWVVTDNTVEDYLQMLRGELVETAAGVKNVAKSFALVKPSAEEPEARIKKIEGIREASISRKGAKTLEDLQIKAKSYFIAPGEVGSSAYKYAWMGLIWMGKVKSGIQRGDYHEYFFYPDADLLPRNRELLSGRFVVKAFKRPAGKGNYWQIWKATEGKPADPIEHRDGGHYELIPAEKLKAIGRKYYVYGRKSK